MRDRLREAFDSVHAEEALKAAALERVSQKIRAEEAKRRPAPWGRRLAPALACLLLVAAAAWGGWGLWFTPTSLISIDINPSLELGVNRFDRVVSVRGFNEDGEALADSLDLGFLGYAEAVEQVLASPAVTGSLAGDGVLSIVVAGDDQAQCGRILADMEACTAGRRNAYCWQAEPGEAEAAHEAGLSCGKYRAFQELQALDPSVTPEEVREMTMGEIRQRIRELSGGAGDGPRQPGRGHHGAGHGRAG